MENIAECHTTLERAVAERVKDQSIKDSDLNPSVVYNESLVDTVLGVGELGTKRPGVGFNKST